MFSFQELVVDGWVSGLILPYLQTLGLVTASVVRSPRDPVTFWEWLWSWFGYTYYTETTVHILNGFGMGACLLLLLLLIPLSFWCCGLTILGTKRLLLMVYRRTRFLLVAYWNTCMCVFRWLASDKDPGAIVRIVSDAPEHVVGVLPESLKEGSPLTSDYEIPNFQASIGALVSGTFQAKGCCVRVDIAGHGPFLIVPEHVWAGTSDDVHLHSRGVTCALSKAQLPNTDGRERMVFTLDTDLLAVQVTDREVSSLKLKVTEINNGFVSSGVLAKIVGPQGRGSMGTIRSHPNTFGYYTYEGSTVGGFSGAAYVVGNRAIAVHLSGGSVNLGYSLRLAYLTLQYQLKVRLEDSGDFLIRQFKDRKQRVWFDETWGHSDTVRLQVGGEYHIMDRSKVHDVLGDVELQGWIIPECAYSENFPQARDSGVCESSIESPQAETQKLLKEIVESNKRSLQYYATLKGDITKLKRTLSVGQGQTPTPPKASSTTSNTSQQNQ